MIYLQVHIHVYRKNGLQCSPSRGPQAEKSECYRVYDVCTQLPSPLPLLLSLVIILLLLLDLLSASGIGSRAAGFVFIAPVFQLVFIRGFTQPPCKTGMPGSFMAMSSRVQAQENHLQRVGLRCDRLDFLPRASARARTILQRTTAQPLGCFLRWR